MLSGVSSLGVSRTAVAGGRTALLDAAERNSLFIAALSVTWVALLVRVPVRLNQDGWLALVAGREVADHGIPQHDRLAALTQGARWIDQQWLSQLALYELERVGGLAAYCVVYVGLAVMALGLAIVAARRLGAADLHIVLILLVPTIIFVGASGEVRTQGFAYPLFVSVLWLMTAESRRPSRWGLLAFPLLVLWANLHGSVTLGVGLVVLHGVSQVFTRAAEGSTGRPWGRALLFVVGGPLCLLATPYGLGAITYYSDTLANPTFRQVISEWAPVTSIMLLAVPFFLVAFGATWLLGRGGRRHGVFEHLALYMTIAAGITAVRNVTWLGLTAIVLLPGLLGTAYGPPKEQNRKRGINLAIAGGSLVLLLGTIVAVAAQPRAWFEQGYDQRVRTVVAAAMQADPRLRVHAGDRFTDWLLWHEPRLAGRVSYDSRLELLTDHQLHQLSDYGSEKGTRSGDIVKGFGLLVLDPERQKSFTRARLREPGTRTLLRGDGAIVAQRPQR